LKNKSPSINEIADIRAAQGYRPLSNIFVLESHQQLGF
jgi:hypothetical protein